MKLLLSSGARSVMTGDDAVESGWDASLNMLYRHHCAGLLGTVIISLNKYSVVRQGLSLGERKG